MTRDEHTLPWTEEARLAALARYGILDAPPEKSIDDIVGLVSALLDCPVAAINLAPLAGSICAHALREPDMLVVPDASRDPRFADHALVTASPGMRFHACALLKTPDGLPLGTLCAMDAAPRPAGLSAQQRSILQTLTGQVMAQFEMRRRLREQEALLREKEAAGVDEERFRSLVLASAQVVWMTDPSGRVIADSSSWRAYTGQSYEEWAGHGWLDAVHIDDRERANEAWMSSTRECRPYEVEYRLHHAASGAHRWTVARGHPIRASDGSIREWVGTNTDIHDRRLAETALQAWGARLEAIFEAGDIGAWSWDMQADRVEADDTVAALYGLSAEEARGAPLAVFLRAIHRDDAEAVRASLQNTLATGEPHQMVHRAVHANGRELTVNARGRVEYDAAGRAVRVSGVLLDITRQVDTERRLRTSESARLRGEQRYRTVLNSIDEGFCIIEMLFDAQGNPCDYRIVEINPAFVLHTGLKDAVGKTIRELIPTHDLRWSRIYGRVARTGLPVRFQQHTANLGRWLEVYAARIGEPENFQVAVFLRDITEERQGAEALQQLADDLAAANRRQSEFLATLAHELRNPLAPVRTGLDLLRIGAGKPGVLERVRPMMERQINHLVHLVDDLLDLARINSGKVELKKADVLLKDVLLRAVEMTQPLIEARGHAFTHALPDEDLAVYADATRLAQVVGNLLTNAAKYTAEGGRVGLRAWREGARACVEVKDSGIGIPAADLPRIFDMFTQVGRHPEQETGLGIGLHLVRQMTELHGGTVRADSAGPGQGSLFTIELPLAGMPAVAARAARAGGAQAGGEGPAPVRSLRILLADDNLDALELLRDVLELDGHTVAVAGNGAEALELAAGFVPDIAFLDIGMPGLDGYEVARRLRAMPALGHAKLVALTGWGTQEDRARSEAAGFDRHLTKPVELDALKALIRGAGR